MTGRDPDELTIAPDGRPAAEQPRWRQDFPIDLPQDQYIARREFTKFLALTSGAFVVGQVWILMRGIFGRRATFPELRIAGIGDLPIGGSLQFGYPEPGDPCLLIRLGERRFVAYDQRCTHLSCPVVPQFDRGRLHCPCHNGNFDLASGRALSGPPRRPLPRIELQLRAGAVWAVGITERTS